MDEEVEASPVARWTPCPIGLHSVEEKKKKEEEERERESQQQLQEGRQQLQQEGEEGEEGSRQQGDWLEELLEQDRQQELQELQRQQQQMSQQLEELLEPPPRSPPQPVPPSPQRPETGEEGLPVYGTPTPAWLCPGGQSPSRPSPGGRTASWLSRAQCAHQRILNRSSRALFTAWTGLPRGSSETVGRGRNPSPRKGMRLVLPVEVRPTRPGHGARLMMTGGSLPSSTYSCATEVRSIPFKC